MANAVNVQYREVSRKAAVGERIKVIIGGSHGDGHHNVGDIRYVIFADRWSNGSGVSVSERNYEASRWDEGTGINHDRYVVLEPLESAPSPLSAPLSADPLYAAFLQFVADNAAEIRAILPEVEGLYSPKEPQLSAKPPIRVAPIKPDVPRKLTRAEVIAKARADVAELLRIGNTTFTRLPEQGPYFSDFFTVEFHTNRTKRTVTALVYRGLRGKRVPDTKFTAKCSPTDVFHADLGKAIALRKALGLTVPTEYTDAPQPDKAHAGAKVGVKSRLSDERQNVFTVSKKIVVACDHLCEVYVNETLPAMGKSPRILDDTDVDYSAVTAKGVAA